MGFMDANKSSDLLAWWTLDEATLSQHYHARTQVSSRFRAGLRPDSIMDFGLTHTKLTRYKLNLLQDLGTKYRSTKERDVECTFHA